LRLLCDHGFVTPRQRAWLLVLTVMLVCGLMVCGAFWYRSRTIAPIAMLKRMPAGESVVLYLDIAQLRRLGVTDRLFDNSRVGQDPEYQRFIQQIDFDFRNDLDAAMLAFAPNGKYMLLRGRFDWPALYKYVDGQGGHCNNGMCNLIGSTQERHISFFPLQRTIMALAVGPSDGAADRLNAVDQRSIAELPNAPMWLMIPASVLRSGNDLPAGTKMFADKMQRAQSATIWIAGDKDQFAAHLDVRCSSISDAVAMASDLTGVTHLLRRMIESENQIPNPADLSGFLTAGTFHNEGTRVVGDWPIHQALIETLFGK
jgi:hypothetical protein